MVEQLKRAAFAGIGMAVMTKDKVEEMAKKLVSEGNVSEQEGRKFVDEMVKKSQETRQAVEKMVQEGVNKALEAMHLPTKADIQTLEKRIKDLEDSH